MYQFSGVSSPTPLVVLFDCGSQLSFLKCSKVPKECAISTVEQPVCGLTSTSHLTEEVTLTGIMLPDFSASKHIDSSLRCLLLDEQQEDSTYDMILGLDFLCAVGINILFHQKQLKWDDATLAFQPRDTYKETHANIHARLIEAFAYGNEEDDPEGLAYKSTQIMEAKYEAIDTDELAQAQKQLMPQQRTDWHASFTSFHNSLMASCIHIRTIFPKHAHILTLLTALTSQKSGNVTWSAECQHTFDTIKAILSSDVLLRYPDHNKPFHVYTDASDLQLGAIIVQDDQPVAFYSRKLNTAQCNYTTMEKELLSIVKTLKEFRTMLFGCRELHVWTNHKNLTYTTLNSQCILRWHLFLEDFHPTFHYIPGDHNSLADALSCLPAFGRQDPDAALALSPVEAMLRSKLDRAGQAFDPFVTSSPEAPSTVFSGYSMVMDHPSLVDCFVNLPPLGDVPVPLSFEACAAAQAQDAMLQQKLITNPAQYVQNQLAPNANVICNLSQPNALWKIWIPDSKLDEIIQWHHTHLGHSGIKCTSDMIALHYYHPCLSARCEDLISRCDACQCNKPALRRYGELPPCNAINTAWQEVAINLIGPWTFTVNGASYTFCALTMIDTVTNYCELIQIDNKSVAHVGQKFENEWLSRYPHLQSCIYDQGNEFLGFWFQQHLHRYNIHSKVSTVKNPQSNAVAECLHQTVTNILRSTLYASPLDNQLEAELLIDTALQKATYAMHTTVHTTLKASPGSLAYQRDMILNIPVVADLLDITARRQHLIDERTMAKNQKRISHDYQPNDQVLVLVYKPDKLEPHARGPYHILHTHVNGTVTIRCSPTVTERINICCLCPYRQ